MENKMFCYQCQETAGCKGCTVSGVCGKRPETAALQDGLIYSTKGLAQMLTILRKNGAPVREEWNDLVRENLFITITNANFDDERIRRQIIKTQELKRELSQEKSIREAASESRLSEAARWTAAETSHPGMGVLAEENEDIRSLRELITYGVKGMAAYLKHAAALGYRSGELDGFMQKALAAVLDDRLDADALTHLTLETGKYGVEAMALLDRANTETYGNPEITKVEIGC